MSDPTTITATAAAVVATLGGICIPIWIRWREKRKKSSEVEVVSWEGMNKALRDERDHLQNRLDTAEERGRQQMKQMEENFETRTFNMRRRIAELETEVQALHLSLRSLGGAP